MPLKSYFKRFSHNIDLVFAKTILALIQYLYDENFKNKSHDGIKES